MHTIHRVQHSELNRNSACQNCWTGGNNRRHTVEYKQHYTEQLSGRNSNVAVIFCQSSCSQLLDGSEWPSDTLECKLDGKWHINDDLLLSGLLLVLDLLDVVAAHIPNVTSNVQEPNGGDLQLPHSQILQVLRQTQAQGHQPTHTQWLGVYQQVHALLEK